MRWTIDRIEPDCFVVEREDLSTASLPLAELPEGAREGDILTADADGTLRVDADATASAREKLSIRLRNLFERRDS